MRDNFKETVKQRLAQKAGFICSYPQCRVRTGNCQLIGTSIPYNVGQAAHITAASPGGPRYDASLTSEERSAESNGIWLCYTHAKLIDSMSCQYSAKMLRMWKAQHEHDVQNNRFNNANTTTSGVCRYIQELTVSGLGPFVEETQFPFGRINFIVGGNGVGKTALTQMACWFVGGAAHEMIRKRFLEACGSDYATLSVKYGEENDFRDVRYVWNKRGKRLILDAQESFLENVLAVQSSQRALVIDDCYDNVTSAKRSTGFRHIVSGFAKLIGLDYSDLLLLLAARSDRVTAVGYKIKLSETGNMLLVDCHNNGFYQKYATMSGSERILATLDISLRCIDLIPPSQSWLFIIEHSIVERLYCDFGQWFSDILFCMPPNIQLMVCVVNEKTISGLIKDREQSFVCSNFPSCFGDLCVFTSRTSWLI